MRATVSKSSQIEDGAKRDWRGERDIFQLIHLYSQSIFHILQSCRNVYSQSDSLQDSVTLLVSATELNRTAILQTRAFI